MCNTSQSCFDPHACACERSKVLKCARHWQDWETCACDEVFCLQPSVACTTFANVCTRNLWNKNLRMCKNLAKWLPHKICKESAAITFSTTCDLAIECFGVRAIDGLDVRVATIVVRMMKRKKVATRRFSNLGSVTPVLFAMLHWNFFVSLSFFGMKEFCRPCPCRRLVRIFFVVLKSFRALIGPAWRSSSLNTSVIVISYRWLWCQVQFRRCRSSWGGPGIGKFFLSIRGLAENFDTFRLLSPDHNGVVSVFPSSSSGIHCFPMVSLPLSFAVFFFFMSTLLVQGNKELESGFDPLYCFFIRSKTNAAAQKVSPSGMCFNQLDIDPSSCNSMLPSSWIVRLESSLNLMDFSDGSKSSMVYLVREPLRKFCTTSWICPFLSSSSKITRCAIPSILKSTSNSDSSFSTGDSVLRFSFLTLSSSGLSVRLPWSSFRTSFLVPENALSDVSCCSCCFCSCDYQVILSTIFGAGRGVKSLSNQILSPFSEITL